MRFSLKMLVKIIGENCFLNCQWPMTQSKAVVASHKVLVILREEVQQLVENYGCQTYIL